MNPKDGMRAIHPGEVLREEFLTPMKISEAALARAIGVPANRINGIVAESRALTADTALRLAVYFSMSVEFWLNLQQSFDVKIAEKALGKRVLAKISPLKKGGQSVAE